MKEYTSFELNMMITGLEGGKLSPSYSLLPVCNNYHDWSLLGPLMDKYEVEISYEFKTCGFSKASMSKFDTEFKSKSEIPRAIIICILKSKNII